VAITARLARSAAHGVDQLLMLLLGLNTALRAWDCGRPGILS
jgi:hypothetical protein